MILGLSGGVRRTPGGTALTDVALATCSLLPDLDDDERLLVPALAELGIGCAPRVWDDPAVRWADFRSVVLRSTWDYADRRGAFLDWCGRVPMLLNPLDVVAWNTDKVYLRDLERAGVPIVPTTWIDTASARDGFTLPGGELVVKPSVSAGARNTSRYPAGDHAGARSHVERLLDAGRTVMVQPYVASVDASGETGLVYIDGVFSHAIGKGPLLHAPGVATDRMWAPEEITEREADVVERRVAEAALDATPFPRDRVLYARVDVVRGDDGGVAVLELELTEPSLFLGRGHGASERLAAGIARRLQQMRDAEARGSAAP